MNEGALTKKDRMRIELAVRKIDWELDGRIPRARRRQILNELRSNLTDAAASVGGEKAVQQLGDLKTLANSYRELYRTRFDVRAGAFWAFIAYAAIQLLGLALFFAFRAGVLAGGSHGASYSFEIWPGFGPFAGKVSAGGTTNSFEVLIGSPAHILIVALAFAIGSTYRGVFTRRRA
ncbi:MAG TPA: hypothetical protein VGX95_05065 [Xanthobacteraceae bacterium]|jgi:hypothetical protein|nr:hypothetical protein [Xanthobacteraceae bacterium]